MDFDLTWLLWALPLVFAAGWLASRLDLRQWRLEGRTAPKSYFKGLNYLLNEQHDEAIDAFIQAVQQDPDTTELHFALGNLFRRRGDYDRAVRVHEHLLQRADLSLADNERARHALALDFLKAGLLDRAEEALKQLKGTAYEAEALMALLGLFERTRDWPQALNIARQLEKQNRGSFGSRMAHYLCEQAQEALRKNDADGAQACWQQALERCPESARTHLELAQWLTQQQQTQAALTQLNDMVHKASHALPLAALQMAELALATGQTTELQSLLTQAQAQAPCTDFVRALDRLHTGQTATQRQAAYLDHLKSEPSLVAAVAWLQLETAPTEQGSDQHLHLPADVQRALDRATRPLQRYRCAACGFEAERHFWQCPGCQTWDSYSARRVEEL